MNVTPGAPPGARPGTRVGAAGQTPASTSNDDRAALLRLLQLEADLRRMPTERELIHHLANESRSVLGFRQAFVLRFKRRWRLEAVSSVAGFDRNAPLNRQVAAFVAGLSKDPGPQLIAFNEGGTGAALTEHTFRHGIWIPLTTRAGRVFAGVLVLRERPWRDDQLPLAERLAGAYAHGWQALAGRTLERRGLPRARVVLPIVLAGLLAAGFLPAPLTVLAPAEVVGQDRVAVTAPLDGVLEEILVDPNAPVRPGDVLARYDSTDLRNALEIADKRVIVAQAELEKLQNAAFGDRVAGRDARVAEAELELALAERALARDRLDRVDIRATAPGIAVFDDARDLTGRPVTMGQSLMQVVGPEETEFTIRLPVRDSIVLTEADRVRVFLDSRPLEPIEATLLRSSYHATTHADGSFGYTLVARADPSEMADVRLGAQGTAQVFGAEHSLHFILFRRPLSWLRQTFGL